MMSVAFLILLGAWSLLSIATQIPSLHWMVRWFHKKDCFGLVPGWSFFTYPKTDRLNLWYRDTLLDGYVTSWKEVTFSNPSLWRALWNPKRRHWKALTFACHSLLEENNHEEHDLFARQPYLLMLNTILALPHQNGSYSRQFLIACTSKPLPARQAEIIFLSLNHQL